MHFFRRKPFGSAVFSLFLALYFLTPGNLGAQTPQGNGASLFLGPSQGTFSVGSTFAISIYLNTRGQFVNAIEANLSFPADKLQVVSPTTGTSFIQIWATTPSYSNTKGTLTFRGGVRNPGINVESGIISTVTFRVIAPGSAAIRILDGSAVFLADGLATNVLTNTSGGLYTLTLPPPAGPIVTSPTHPDQTRWSQNNDVVFRLERGSSITKYSYVLSNSVAERPDTVPDGSEDVVLYENLADGLYYFHVRAGSGKVWGGVTTYPVKIDTTPPSEFEIKTSFKEATTSKGPIFVFDTTDNLSGIDHYELRIVPQAMDRGSPQPFENSEKKFFEAQSPHFEEFDFGAYDLTVRAFDRAGNFTETSKHIKIARPLFEVFSGEGVRLAGTYTVRWGYFILMITVLILALMYGGYLLWKWHRRMELQSEAKAFRNPELLRKLEVLKEKQEDYIESAEKFMQ